MPSIIIKYCFPANIIKKKNKNNKNTFFRYSSECPLFSEIVFTGIYLDFFWGGGRKEEAEVLSNTVVESFLNPRLKHSKEKKEMSLS